MGPLGRQPAPRCRATMPRLFISYRRDEAAYVAAMLAQRLRSTFGDEAVYIDVDTIPLGVDFRDHIRSAVGRCDVLLAVIGRQWLQARDAAGRRRLDDPADFVRLEIEAALARSIPVVPVLIDDAPMPQASELPESLAPLSFRNAAELRAGRDMDHHLGLIVDGLQRLLAPQAEAPPPPPPASAAPASATGQLRLVRERQLGGSALACRVFLDGNEIGELRSGDMLEWKAAPGPHRLEVRHRGALFDASADIVIAAGRTQAWRVGLDWKGAIRLTPD